MEEDKKDVQDSSTSETEDSEVETEAKSGNNKDINFAKLRDEVERLKKENAELKGTPSKDKKPVKLSEAQQLVFNRDLKEAKLKFKSLAKTATPEELAEVEKLALSGEETETEILNKFKSFYEGLPTVRERREKEIAANARRQAMQQMTDDELDLGSGGDVDFGGESTTHFNSKESRFLDAMGVTKEERKKIEKDANTNEWTPGREPKRKFFQARNEAS